MRIPLELPGCSTQKLEVEPAGWLNNSRLFADGVPLVKVNGWCSVPSDKGETVKVCLVRSFLDPIPRMNVEGGATILLARALKWYEYLWMSAPIALVFGGSALGCLLFGSKVPVAIILALMFIDGVLGAFFGLMAIAADAAIFRSKQSMPIRYLQTGLISGAAVIAYVMSAWLVVCAIVPW